MRTIYILLTRSQTIPARIIRACCPADYSHVSMAFEGELPQFYSSSRRGRMPLPAGPTSEHLYRGYYARHPETPCALYALYVSDESYALARQQTLAFVEGDYHYNILGLLFCRMSIAWQRPNHYFCSQFVGEVLDRSGAVELPKRTTLLHPMDYAQMPQLTQLYEGTVGGMMHGMAIC